MNISSDRQVHEHIRRQTTLEAASMALAEFAHDLGWDLVAFHADKNAVELPRGKSGEFIASMLGWPTDCLRDWREFSLGRNCPIAQLCGRAADPFRWSCDARDDAWFGGSLSAEQRRVLDHYGRYVTDGIAVPVRLVNGNTGYVSWCSREGGFPEVVQRHLGSMFFISHTFIRHAEWLLDKHDKASGRLTERERECLTWAARGKNEEEIAAIIFRSRDTVHFHLRNAALKLDAGNRTHAVAIACMRGLISLR